MTRIRLFSAPLCSLLIGIAWLAAGCDDDDTSAPVSSGAPDSGASESTVIDAGQRITFGGSDCRACLGTACASAIAGCGAEPGCANRLDCLDACPLGSDGNVDPACADACPNPSGTAEASARSGLESCLEEAPCAECGTALTPVEQVRPALLSQQCETQEHESACTECELNRCCDTRAACENDRACMEYLACLQDIEVCPASASLPECIAACDERGLTGYGVLAPRVACISARCTEECTEMPVNPCQACIYGTCADSYSRCQSSEDCVRLEMCTVECQGDFACIGDCQARYPLAVGDLEAELQCELQYCGNLCP